jgi:hypothetical protein
MTGLAARDGATGDMQAVCPGRESHRSTSSLLEAFADLAAEGAPP